MVEQSFRNGVIPDKVATTQTYIHNTHTATLPARRRSANFVCSKSKRNYSFTKTYLCEAKKTKQKKGRNLSWALIYNVSVLPLAISGTLKPWMAALGMSLSSLLVVLNATRLVRGGKRPEARQP